MLEGTTITVVFVFVYFYLDLLIQQTLREQGQRQMCLN